MAHAARSDLPAPRRAADIHGPATVTTIVSRRGGTIRSATSLARRCSFATKAAGAFWSATPLPAGNGQPYVARHGQGYSAFEHTRNELASELVLFVTPQDPVKVFQLRLKNLSSRRRRVSVTLYAEWVLGENRSRTALHVVTATDPAPEPCLARNVFRQEFSTRVAFLDLSGWRQSKCDRRPDGVPRAQWFARRSLPRSPRSLCRIEPGPPSILAAPCASRSTSSRSGNRMSSGLLGDADERGQASRAGDALSRRRDVGRRIRTGAAVLGRVCWERSSVKTPDRAMDLVLNRWLLYQTLACRIWGRSAFYQSSGAFGFRDQLQDTLALLHVRAAIVRAHLLHAASRQFVEGDVQHWWHEPGGQGVRTRFSDDRLWLPYATLQYIAATGDQSVLDEQVPFIDGAPAEPGRARNLRAPVGRCRVGVALRALRRARSRSASATGAHGLPLMGTGDWNDGMNLVGAGGKGESVWLGWFLMSDPAPVRRAREAARRRRRRRPTVPATCADAGRGARRCMGRRRGTGARISTTARRSARRRTAECQIDAIAQSWAVHLRRRRSRARAAGDGSRRRAARAS